MAGVASAVLVNQERRRAASSHRCFRLAPFHNAHLLRLSLQRCINGSPGLLALLLTAENKFALSHPAPPPTTGSALLLSEMLITKLCDALRYKQQLLLPERRRLHQERFSSPPARLLLLPATSLPCPLLSFVCSHVSADTDSWGGAETIRWVGHVTFQTGSGCSGSRGGCHDHG